VTVGFDGSGAGNALVSIEEGTTAFVNDVGVTLDTPAATDTSTSKFIYATGDTTNLSSFAANTLTITTDEKLVNVTLTVQAFLDADLDGFKDTFEQTSDVETIVLYAASNVTATTSIDYLARDNAFPQVSVVYNNNINPYMVQGDTTVKLFNNGSLANVDPAYDITAHADSNTFDFMSVGIASASVDADFASAAGSRTPGLTKNVLTAGVDDSGVVNAYSYLAIADVTDADYPGTTVDFAAGVYTAQAYYAATSVVAVGAGSRAVDLTNGSNADVDTLDATVTSTASLGFTASNNDLAVKTGATSFVANVQAQDTTGTSLNLKKSNIKVRATVTADTLDSGVVSVSGSAAALVEDGVTVAYGYTNSSGVASFTITNTGASEDDVVTAKFEILTATGTWADAETITATWADAALESWESVGGNYVSGSAVSVTFAAEDQFGAPVSTDGTSALSVVATAYVGGIAKATTYSKTVSVVDGEATFTFDNFAAAGGSAQLQATLNAGTSAAVLGSGSATITVNVYNTNATDSVTVASSFETAISYTDFATGKVSALTEAPIASETDFATITGNVLDVNGVGQPGVAVTLSADGVLFKDASVYAEDTITTYANEYGAISVDVYSHAVNIAGATVSITADGVTTSTLLQTTLPVLVADENLAFSWNLPAEIVKNTTYAVVATLTDKWGNPVAATDPTPSAAVSADYGVAFQGTGSIEINGVGSTVYKDFSSKGEVTVFVRSIKDIAGPGAVSATLGTAWYYPTTLLGVKTVAGSIGSSNTVDDTDTVWDETLWASTLSAERDVKDAASVATAISKVNAGSFKGYVAIYAKGHKGSKLSAKVGKDWVIVDALASDYERIVELVGPGVDVTVRIYIDKVLFDTISLTTK
jgi:hypothetical protein